MLLTDARSRLRVDLSDVDETLLEDDVLNRSVHKAVSDLSRFLPRDQVLEITLIFAVTTPEAWASAAAAGTYVALANMPIKYDSETVLNNAGVTCVRDTDYYMDYTLGKITHIDSSRIGNAEDCTISYTKSEITVDLTSILDSLIRVEGVEYPLGDVPQTFVTYSLILPYLTVTGGFESQAVLSANKHLVVHYKAKHTVPTPSAEGSYPSFLDDTVVLAASAYALFAVALKYEVQALTDFESARTELGLTTAIHTLADTALDAAATALGKATTALGSTKVDDFLSGASAPSSKKYLEDGDTFLNAIPIGADVAANHAIYAQRSSEIALSFIRQAQEHNSNGNGYVAEGSGRIAEIDRLLGEADRYITIANQGLNLAEMFRAEAIERRNEAWAIWKDSPQFAPLYTSTPVRQTNVD